MADPRCGKCGPCVRGRGPCDVWVKVACARLKKELESAPFAEAFRRAEANLPKCSKGTPGCPKDRWPTMAHTICWTTVSGSRSPVTCTERHIEEVCEACGECLRCSWHATICDAVN